MTSVTEILKASYREMMTGNTPMFLGIGILSFVTQGLFNYVTWWAWLIAPAMNYGLFRSLHSVKQTGDFKVEEFLWFFLDINRFFRGLIIHLILSFLTAVGFLLFVFPGFIVLKRYLWVLPLFAINDHLSVADVFRQSKTLSDQFDWNFVVPFFLVILALLILGALLLGIGLIFTTPLIYLMILRVIELNEPSKSTTTSGWVNWRQ